MYLKNSDEFEIVEKEGSLVSVGIGGSLTSRKIDVLIMDDLYRDAQSAWSPTIRENVEEWYLTVGKTRLHKDSQQLLVFTRWHEDDLAGHLLRTEPDDWEVILFEAIKTDIPRENDPREVGEQLWAAQHTMESLIKIRENNPIIFESLFQQNPTPKEGLLLPISDLKRFKMEQIKSTTPDGIISTTDTADEGADSLCQLVGYIYGDDVYIPDVIFTQEPIEITEPMCASQIDLHNVKRAYFESNNGGKGFARKVKELIRGRTTVRWHHTSKNKHTKIIMSSGIIKQNFYFLEDDEQSKMYQRYFYELTHYPTNGKSKHDDAPDATSMLENKISSKAGIGFLR
jgi:predicted phage terminase large subunit-like protein